MATSAPRKRRVKSSGGEAELLAMSVEEGARVIALRHLYEAGRNSGRLTDSTDAEALHDFRVAVRRLRSAIRAYRPFLETVSGKLRRALREPAQETGTARDAEVQVEWLGGLSLDGAAARARDWLLARIGAHRDEAYDQLKRDVLARFERISHRLEERLSCFEVKVKRGGRAPRRSFPDATAEILDGFGVELLDHLARVRSPSDEEEAHEARIAAKRLRYLVEPLVDDFGEAKEMLSELKSLQELLGNLHDAAVMGAALRPAIEAAAAERARHAHERALADRSDEETVGAAEVESGLLVIARMARDRRDRLFSELHSRWLGGERAVVTDELHDLAEALRRHDYGAERVLLLRGLPDSLAALKPVRVEEGWLAGRRVEERIRRVGEGERARYTRVVTVNGRTVEESATPELAAAMWPLTEERRLTYLRYRLRAPDQGWEIRHFAAQNVVYALRAEHRGARGHSPPAWLCEWIEQDVSRVPERWPESLVAAVPLSDDRGSTSNRE